MTARLRSLEEIDTHRGGFADAARMVLVNANGKVGQMGALADFIDVEPRYERAVEACLGDLLQHVLVERLDHVSAGLKLIRQEDAGRCGFVVGVEPSERRGRFQVASLRTARERRRRHGVDVPLDVRVDGRRQSTPAPAPSRSARPTAPWRCRRWSRSAGRSRPRFTP